VPSAPALCEDRAMARDLRVVMIGAGWIVPFHLAALDRLGRTTIVGVASARRERAAAVAEPFGAAAGIDPIGMVDDLRPDAVWLCVPPFRAVSIGEALVDRGVPFLTEKPLAATDAEGPARLAAAIERRGLVVAVGYHLRGVAGLGDVRDRIAGSAPLLVAGRWLDETPGPAWWRRVDQGGGQVIEQATHLYDLGRHLVGEPEVAAARSIRREPAVPRGADVADGTTAILHYANGAIGSFINSRRARRRLISLEIVTDAAHVSIDKASDAPGDWRVSMADGKGTRTLPGGRDPYEVQAEAFLDAVEVRDPERTRCTYADALRTDRLTRAVVAATGTTG
jgi:predicted dehydrogenase